MAYKCKTLLYKGKQYPECPNVSKNNGQEYRLRKENMKREAKNYTKLEQRPIHMSVCNSQMKR